MLQEPHQEVRYSAAGESIEGASLLPIWKTRIYYSAAVGLPLSYESNNRQFTMDTIEAGRSLMH
jgi:hypothetical protein